MRNVANFVLFQICWFAAVWGAANQMPWLGPACTLGFLAVETWLANSMKRLMLLVLAIAALGFVADSLYTQFGLIEFASPGPFPQWAPLWIVGLWIAFGLTLNHSLAYLGTKPMLAAICGLVAGPLAYWIALDVWNAGTYDDRIMTGIAVALVWGIATPLSFKIARTGEPQPC